MLKFLTLFMAPDTGGGIGGETTDVKSAEEVKIEEEKKEVKEKEVQKSGNEAEAELEEIKKMRAAAVTEYKKSCIEKLGLDEKYISLLHGSNVEEISASGIMLSEVISNIKSATETDIKKAFAKTGAPGTGETSKELDEAEYYRALTGGNK